MRRGELAGVRWPDLDLEASELVVVENRVVVEHAVVTGTPKGNRDRLGLDALTVEVLRAWRRQHLAERLVRRAVADTDLVFLA